MSSEPACFSATAQAPMSSGVLSELSEPRWRVKLQKPSLTSNSVVPPARVGPHWPQHVQRARMPAAQERLSLFEEHEWKRKSVWPPTVVAMAGDDDSGVEPTRARCVSANTVVFVASNALALQAR